MKRSDVVFKTHHSGGPPVILKRPLMANEERLPELELSLGLSVGVSSRRMPPPADGTTGGLLSLNFTTEDGKASRGDLQYPTKTGIGAASAVTYLEEERLVPELQGRESRTRGRDSREEEVLEAHRWSSMSILGGNGNPLVVPVQYPSHPQVMYVPAVDGFGVPCMIPCWVPAVLPEGEGSNLPVARRCSGTAEKGVMPARTDSTGSSSSDISARRSVSKRAKNMSKIWSSSSSDERGKSLHIVEKHPSQKDASSLVQGTNEQWTSSIPTSDITSASAILMLVNKPIVVAKEPERSPLPRMPCVAATGDGPNGKRITGVLYKYIQSKEVSILCACHCMPFSPAEFVRHAGGTETAHPLRQIVVVPSRP